MPTFLLNQKETPVSRPAPRGRLWWGLGAAVLASLFASVPFVTTALVSAAPSADSGLQCTTSPSATFNLTASSGYITTPDANTIFMWGFGTPAATATTPGDFQLPGPLLCVTQNQTVTITLTNSLTEDVSIIFPGQFSVLANGAAAQPQFDGTGRLTSLVQTAARNGGAITYSFVAREPGTYIYASGTDQGKQVQMGLFGALVVRPAAHADWAYNRADTQFNPGAEYMMLFSEVDPLLHQAVERGLAFDITTYHPRYWMINGRSFPDTISANNTPWLPTQPYNAFVHIRPKDGANPLPALVRYLNLGQLHHPFHPHMNNHRVVARDGRLLEGPTGQDLSYEKFGLTVGAGQTWDATTFWQDVEHWNPTTNRLPVTLPQQQNLTYKGNQTWYSGSPYLGYKGDLPVGVTSYNECGEYYAVWHSHALNEAANWDTGFGGIFTLERIDPAPPNTCSPF
jgi:FtsP/CotA-like multicopper oxidase with cupredoxin domain